MSLAKKVIESHKVNERSKEDEIQYAKDAIASTQKRLDQDLEDVAEIRKERAEASKKGNDNEVKAHDKSIENYAASVSRLKAKLEKQKKDLADLRGSKDEELSQEFKDQIKANNDKMTDLKDNNGSQEEIDKLEKENDDLNGGNQTSEGYKSSIPDMIRDTKNSIKQLVDMVNTYSQMLKLGKKVRAEDFLENIEKLEKAIGNKNESKNPEKEAEAFLEKAKKSGKITVKGTMLGKVEISFDTKKDSFIFRYPDKSNYNNTMYAGNHIYKPEHAVDRLSQLLDGKEGMEESKNEDAELPAKFLIALSKLEKKPVAKRAEILAYSIRTLMQVMSEKPSNKMDLKVFAAHMLGSVSHGVEGIESSDMETDLEESENPLSGEVEYEKEVSESKSLAKKVIESHTTVSEDSKSQIDSIDKQIEKIKKDMDAIHARMASFRKNDQPEKAKELEDDTAKLIAQKHKLKEKKRKLQGKN